MSELLRAVARRRDLLGSDEATALLEVAEREHVAPPGPPTGARRPGAVE